MSTARRLAAEGLGTGFLLVAVVGSGIMAERLAGGNVAVALLANAIATGAALYVLITLFAPLSGAHFNPLVTLMARADGALCTRLAAAMIAVQVTAAVAGVVATHLMFELPALLPSARVRTGMAQWLAEFIATLGLILVIRLGTAARANVAALVAAYITGAYWFTASTSFANPAVTIARALTDTFAGIRPADAPAFIAAQALGAIAAVLVARRLEAPDA